MSAFADREAVARYPEGPPRLVPGFAGLQRMAAILIAERAPRDARVLVVGAGGGLEIKAFAEAHEAWSFVGVDPSVEMLELAAATLGRLAARAQLIEGVIDSAPAGPFDAATCILTLHFVERDERLRTLVEIRRRLRRDAPFVAAHFSIPQGVVERSLWLDRYAAFAVVSGVPAEQAKSGAAMIGKRLPILSPEQDEELMRAAGFGGVSLFYAGFAFRGWVAYA